jgi:hypothetical protein
MSLTLEAPIMESNAVKGSLRINAANPNHHLWNNNGIWYVHYTVHPTPHTKSRVRESLKTKSLDEARQRRDNILSRLDLSFA